MILSNKRRLRLVISQQTAMIPRTEKIRQAQEVFSRLEHMDSFRKAKDIGLFWSMSDEVPTHAFIEKWATRKNIYLPVVGERLYFARYTPECEMIQGGLRVLVPQGTPEIEPSRLDLLIIPGIAFDPYGGRLGRGKGYYDRFMGSTQAVKIGICLEHQLLGEVPTEAHDKRVDMVMTPSGTFVSIEDRPEGGKDNHHGTTYRAATFETSV